MVEDKRKNNSNKKHFLKKKREKKKEEEARNVSEQRDKGTIQHIEQRQQHCGAAVAHMLRTPHEEIMSCLS